MPPHQLLWQDPTAFIYAIQVLRNTLRQKALQCELSGI
jgi:hypothetical protein